MWSHIRSNRVERDETRDDSDNAALLGWCVTANISAQPRRGPDPDRTYHGTRVFSPGTKVYLGEAYWGVMGQSLHVIGLHRKSRRFVNCVITVAVLERLRTRSIYSPKLWVNLQQLEAECFHTEDDAQELLSKIQLTLDEATQR